jgi:hypothetical protein
MAVNVTTLVGSCDGRTVVTLEGVADEGLFVMLAEGIVSLTSSDRELVVDLGGLTATDATERERFLRRLSTAAGTVEVRDR